MRTLQNSHRSATQIAGPSPLERAKDSLRIPDLWHRLGLPGEPGKSCRSPFREDRTPSFSVSADGLLFNDFASGQKGDAVDFLALALGCDKPTAARRLIEMASTGRALQRRFPQPRRPSPPPSVEMPPLREGTPGELAALSELRGIPIEGLRLAQVAGILRFGAFSGHKAWFVTDTGHRVAQARRMDGENFRAGTKAMTLKGACAAWPITPKNSADKPCFAFCEGGPDLLSAYALMWAEDREADCTAVCMLGANAQIHPAAIPLFAGKRIRVYPHVDEPGKAAARKWAIDLRRAGAVVDAYSFDGLKQATGETVGDLNDFLRLDCDDWESLADRHVMPEGGAK